jgi:tetratricopeptide (TPR) repeat protein
MQSDDSLEIPALIHLWRGELKLAWQAAEDGIAQLGDHRALRDYWIFRFVRAEVLRMRGCVEQARDYLESLGSPVAGDVESVASLTMHIGYCSALLGDYKVANFLLGESLAQACRANLLKLQVEVKLRQAMNSFLQKDLDSAENTYRTLLESSVEKLGWDLHSMVLGGVGKILLHRRRFQEAVPWLEQAIQIAKEAGAPLKAIGFESEVAVCYLGMNDASTSLKMLKVAERASLESGAMHHYQVTLADIGNVYLHQGEYWIAISYYQRALNLAKEMKDPVKVANWTFNLRLAYAKLVERR